MAWIYEQPVKIIFGKNILEKLGELLEPYQRPMLIASPCFVRNGLADRIIDQIPETDLFSAVSPNPDVREVNECSAWIRENGNDILIALGGGSVMDLAKAASIAVEDIREYHGTGKAVPVKHLPVIAVPTTAGTGSEVTAVSVLTDRESGKKLPIASDSFYPQTALVDYALTYSLPKTVTASSGIDVLCHAMEGYWSKNRQPVTNALAVQAIKDVLHYLPMACEHPGFETARKKMAESSIIAGLAFNLPKTTASHACSFPLTNRCKIPHGEACGMTLDFFLDKNRDTPAVKTLIQDLQYGSVDELVWEIAQLKRRIGLRSGLKTLQLSETQVAQLIQESHHPNLKNNPVDVTDDMLAELYHRLLVQE